MTDDAPTNHSHVDDPGWLRPDAASPGLTIPRSWGVWKLSPPFTGRQYRFGNNPVRGDELAREFGRVELIALYTDRGSAEQRTRELNEPATAPMLHDGLSSWHHDHTFGQDQRRPGESRTLIVIAVTALMMVVEIAAGVHYGSMALLADGLHMASHAVALGITAFAYIYARRHARNRQFSFGTGKVNALGGFTGAVVLAVFALYMGVESVLRIINPVSIAFNQAIVVAVLGLVVNGASVFILGVDNHEHEHDHGETDGHDHGHAHHHHDHNLKSAYLHVMADALTSLLAIFALLSAKYFGWLWMDPIMGLVGAGLVAKWSYGLLGTTAAVLLDRQGPERLQQTLREVMEGDGDSRITDLHVWSIGPGIFSAQITLLARHPATPHEYKERIPEGTGVVHVAVEVHRHEETTP